MTHLYDPIFIVGVPRSGTTLVQCILSANSQAFSLPETHYFTILRNLHHSVNDYLAVDEIERIHATLISKSNISIPAPLYTDMVQQAKRQSLKAISLFEALVDSYRPAYDTNKQLRVIEKTPSHYMSLSQISLVYPTAKFVNIVRNPLDVINSLSKPPFASTEYVLARARLWNKALDYINAFCKQTANKVLTIRFEDVVTDAQHVMEKLCIWLNLPQEPEMLSSLGQEFERNTSAVEYWKQNVKVGYILDRRGKWRENVSEGNGWLIERATRRYRRQYGYESQANPSASEVLSASLSMGLLTVSHYGKKLVPGLRG